MHQSEKRCFNLGVTRKLAALGLGKAFKHIGKMRRIDRFRIDLVGRRESKNGARDFLEPNLKL